MTEMVQDLKTPDEWCRLEGVEVMDPDGWRGRNGRPWTDPITLAEFKNRLITSTLRHAVGASAKARAEFAEARDAGLQRRHETREAAAILRSPWLVQPDDLIGGICVTLAVPSTPAQGNIPIANFLSPDVAQHIVNLHNAHIARETS